jgi:hypothetical protein
VRELPNGKRQLLGDVDFEEARKVASYITPVPVIFKQSFKLQKVSHLGRRGSNDCRHVDPQYIQAVGQSSLEKGLFLIAFADVKLLFRAAPSPVGTFNPCSKTSTAKNNRPKNNQVHNYSPTLFIFQQCTKLRNKFYLKELLQINSMNNGT